MNEYLIPANANRGKLIFGLFRQIDILVFGSGLGVTFALLLFFQSDLSELSTALAILSPALITGFLVLPIPNQHNIMVVLGNIYKFYFVNRNKFVWKGWCASNETEEK